METVGDEIDCAPPPQKDEPPGVMSVLCLVVFKRQLWLLPIITALWLFSSFWISYGIAVSYNHTEAVFPYISHTAIEAPERCVFGQLVNIGAVMLAMNVILRYLYVKKRFLRAMLPGSSRWYHINLAALFLGLGSAFGLSMVANFQTEVQRGPHYVGAFLAFGGGTVFCWFHACISFKLVYRLGSSTSKPMARLMVQIQLLNSLIMSALLVLFVTTKITYKAQKRAGMGTKWGELRGVYLTSTFTEWLLAFAFLTYTLTYAPDFKQMRVDDPKIELLECTSSLNRDANANNASHIASPDSDVENGGTGPMTNGHTTSGSLNT